MRWVVVVAALGISGCGGATLVLKSPIEDRCRDTGLQGCPELAEGITKYVDGDKDEARRLVIRAGAANSPAQIKAFAAKLKTLEAVPGAKEYVGPVFEVVDLLVADTQKAGPARAAKKAPTKTEPEPDETDEEVAEARPTVRKPRRSERRTTPTLVRMLVRKGEALAVAVQAPTESRFAQDLRCLVSWGGFRPYEDSTGAAATPEAGL